MKISKKGIKAASIFGGFGLFGLIPIFITFNESIQLMHAIQHHATHITFDKGIYYLFGGGLIFFFIPIFLLIGLIFNPGPKSSKILMRVMVTFFGVCLVSMPLLPQVMSSSVGNYLKNRGYSYCDNLSSQWLFTRTMVYRKDSCHPVGK